jgi:hypothetical protein
MNFVDITSNSFVQTLTIDLSRLRFLSDANMFSFINEIFSKCNELAGGFIRLLWLAPDHLHLYVESDGEPGMPEPLQGMPEEPV